MNLLGWLRRRNKLNSTVTKAPATPVSFDPVERLEGRTLFAAVPIRVATVIADSSGWIDIRFTKSIAQGTILKKVFRMYTPGTDGVLNTVDDVQATASIKWDAATRTMSLKATTNPNGAYRVKLFSSGILDTDGLRFDGEYNATLPSGDGVQGGNFQFKARLDTGNLPTVRIITNGTSINNGLISVRLNKSAAPISVSNFLQYVLGGRYDGTIFHRSGRTEPSPIQIIQGGGYKTAGNPTHIPTFSPIQLEGGIGNSRGTIAFARSTDANSATSEFFFNVQTNTFLNPSVPGLNGYAAFGTVTSGQNLVDAIYNTGTKSFGGAPFATVPMVSSTTPVTVIHAAEQMKIYALAE